MNLSDRFFKAGRFFDRSIDGADDGVDREDLDVHGEGWHFRTLADDETSPEWGGLIPVDSALYFLLTDLVPTFPALSGNVATTIVCDPRGPLILTDQDGAPASYTPRARVAHADRPLVVTSATEDPDLHILVDGRRRNPRRVSRDTWQFFIPARTRTLRLCAGVTPPCMIGIPDAEVAPTICVRSARVTTPTGQFDLDLGNQAVMGRFRPILRDGMPMWLWPGGEAVIPMALLAPGRDAVILTMRLDLV